MTDPLNVSTYVSTAAAKANREFSDDEIRVIRERHNGPEQATCKLLGRVFGVSAQKIARIVNEGREVL